MHRTRLAVPMLVLGLVVAACTGSGATTPTSQPAAAVPSAAPASVAPASVAPASVAPASAAATSDSAGGDYGGYGKGGAATPATTAAAVGLAKTGLGTILVNGKGMTLYMFTPDTTTTSACTAACAANWPPLTGTPTIGSGLDDSKFGSITRADGTKQVSFAGHPLYTFANDQSAGQTNGQGLSGKWYVLGADGNPIK